MALGGVIRGKRTTLRTPAEDDLAAYSRWMADMRVRRAARIWHEPAMPATWKERLKDQAKDHRGVLWSIETEGRLIGLVRAQIGGLESPPPPNFQHFIIHPHGGPKGYGWEACPGPPPAL